MLNEKIQKIIPIMLKDWDRPLSILENRQFEPIQNMIKDFKLDEKTIKKIQTSKIKIILGYYCQEDYEGLAFVLFEKEGRLFEVNASHCSCYGLEDQWRPEETSFDVLMYRLVNSPNCFKNFRKEIHLVLLTIRGDQ